MFTFLRSACSANVPYALFANAGRRCNRLQIIRTTLFEYRCVRLISVSFVHLSPGAISHCSFGSSVELRARYDAPRACSLADIDSIAISAREARVSFSAQSRPRGASSRYRLSRPNHAEVIGNARSAEAEGVSRFG